MGGLERRNLSEDVARRIGRLIVEGRLPPGERINEVDLASSLDVSRTPVREALSRLVSEGFVSSRPRQGFFVQELGPREVEHLYGVRAILDPAALRLAGIPDEERLDELERLNRRIAGTPQGPSGIIALDDRWHLELLAGCPNPILLDLIRRFMRRTRPLEHAYLRERASTERMVAEHGAILGALRAGDLPAAVDALRRNMESAVPILVAWLERAEAPREGSPSSAPSPRPEGSQGGSDIAWWSEGR